MLMAAAERREDGTTPVSNDRSPLPPDLRASRSAGGFGMVEARCECRRACAEFMQMYAGNILNK